MIISLAGYMGCGKSHIAKILSHRLNFKCIDLDEEIALRQGKAIAEIFAGKGEIAFRKIEKETLGLLLQSEENMILSLGGGTPVYHHNIDLINQKSESFYLRASVATLTERLTPEKSHRPLIARIADDDLPEFISKHLFERAPYYAQCRHHLITDGKTPEAITDEIIRLLPDVHHPY
ncbi:shikimate kinase [Weeksellaceae bacterium A-14]